MSAETSPKYLIIDLFCGAGGTTTGAEMSGVCKVIAAVNHDPLAIESHAANHADVLHMEEDILLADTAPIIEAIKFWKQRHPLAQVVLWASLECTNFSNAKGGLPRDADSRSLALAMYRYLEDIKPDYFLIENVREFMAWGDLDENGKPVSKLNGRDYIRWVKKIQSFGYQHDWRLLCAADFGGVTIRERYFGAFWKPSKPFAWPEKTHAKKKSSGTMFLDSLKPWRPVAEVLDFSDLGKSIFDRRRPLVDKTLKRILSGLKKFHAQPTVMVCNSPGYCAPLSEPIGTITTVPSKAILTPILQSYYSGANNVTSVQFPAPTVTTKDRIAIVTPWIDRDFRSGGSTHSVTMPAGTILTVPKMNLCSAFLVPSNFQNSARSIEYPAPTILASRKHINIATAFIVNPQYKNSRNSVFSPAPTVVATQKSRPLSLATCFIGPPKWEIQPGDSQAMVELKTFMRENGIADIFMRMLKVKELLKIQGFPENYRLIGPLNEQKKFIGNSVETGVVKAWFTALSKATS